MLEDGLKNQEFSKDQAIKDIEELKKRTFSVVISCDGEDEKQFVKKLLDVKTKDLKRLYYAKDLMGE